MVNPRAGLIRNPALFICDIQEKFREAIYECPKLISTCEKLLKATSHLPMPIYVTTQNRARLGNTVSEIHKYLYNPETNAASPNLRADVDKTLFSMVTPEIKALLPSVSSEAQAAATAAGNENEPLDVLLVGMESHICIMQTTLDLLSLGHRVYIIADGVSSCNAGERPIALARCRDAGAVVTTSEGVLFEIVRDAKREGFKGVSGVVKETKEETKGAVGTFCKI
ncbi:hypothetical protein FQN54_000746 [Arachnomyces sp. PD_36]|nr:hypothetical protein FQN54_000746 [Arachnomyces sp. PD_36]